jgi:glucokinase
MKTQALIGIDIGGTKINIGKISKGKIIDEIRIPTRPLRTEKQILDDIIAHTKDILDPQVTGIGVGVPGLVESNTGIVYNLTNIPSWENVHLKEYMEDKLGLPVRVANDANCFVLGEKIYGKGKSYENIVGITLGTGLGVGIIINNNLYPGKLSIAGEISGIPYLDSNYEHYCSSKFFINQYQFSAKKISALALSGDRNAIETFQKFGHHLGNLTQTIILAYGPDAIIFGGSLSKSFNLFFPSLMESLSTFPHQNVLDDLNIMDFTDEKIPLMGAAIYALDPDNRENYLNS